MPPSSRQVIHCRSAFPDRPEKELPVEADQSVFEALRQAHHPIASSCDGVAVCGRCVISVLEGARALSDMDAVEQAILRKEGADKNQRLACQSHVEGPGVVLSTDYW
jgi:adenylate cyclase